MLVTVKKPAGAIQFYAEADMPALAGSLPRAASDDEAVDVWDTVFDSPSPEDALIEFIDECRRLCR